jgi:hypothetical protein
MKEAERDGSCSKHRDENCIWILIGNTEIEKTT